MTSHPETETVASPPGGEPATERLDLPFPWESGPSAPPAQEPDALFRFPAQNDPGPGSRRLLGMALCASVLGLLGLAASVRGVIAIMTEHVPSWYEPTVAACGAAGMALVVGAFLAIHRRRLPWLLLLAAVVPLTVDIVAATRAS